MSDVTGKDENPYATPRSGAPIEGEPLLILRSALSKWEKLRLIYNFLLFFAGHGAASLKAGNFWVPLLTEGYILGVIGYAVLVNLLFTVGPALEAYSIAWRRQSLGLGRYILFGLGTAFSFVITFVGGLFYDWLLYV